ncbi:MAG: helix-turn-helix domain-containing protein [Hyphomicrobiaceae bacterium]
MKLNEHIGAQLRVLREKRGESPEKLAAILSISLERYAAFELGRESISARHLYDLCSQLNVPVTYFFEGYEETGLHGRNPKENGDEPHETNGSN